MKTTSSNEVTLFSANAFYARGEWSDGEWRGVICSRSDGKVYATISSNDTAPFPSCEAAATAAAQLLGQNNGGPINGR